ncbi:MAG: hypothetical protein U1F43_16485 [Myxococcota bacterium]
MQEGQPPSEPQRLEDVDPAVLAEIEAEFASITQEIQRISAMPRSSAPKKAELLKQIRADWKAKSESRSPDRPEWRQRLDTAVDAAIDKLLVDSLVDMPDGQIGFQLRGDSMQTEAPPIIRALLDGLFANWQERLKPAPGQPPNPFAPILTSLGAMLSQAFSGIKVGGTPAAAEDAKGATHLDVGLEQPLEAHVKFSSEGPPVLTTGPLPEAPSADAAATDASDAAKADAPKSDAPNSDAPKSDAPNSDVPKSDAPKSDVGREFFAQLMGGLGQMLQRSLAAKPSAPTASEPTPTPAPTTATTATTPTATAPSEPTPTPTDSATAPPTATPAAPDAAAPTIELKQPNAGDGPPATVKIDLQGLLAQLLGNLKPPSK